VVADKMPDKCPKCGCTRLKQDEDTLDTWFSSALWPFSTLGWPEKSEDLDYFYPTDVLVTGYDIIFFWVIRMVFSGYAHTGKSPFHTVYVHGLIRDSLGRKMSKSLGNGINPLDVIDKYGADALRLTLVTGNAPGNDMRFYDERVEASRNFANKVWNASRFIMMYMEGHEDIKKPASEAYTVSDRWIISELNRVAGEVTENMDKYELGIAVDKIHDFIWEEFCDWYIEIAKYRLNHREENPESADTALWTLREVLTGALKLLHPFMPFITEEIYCTLNPEEETIMLAKWPERDEAAIDEASESAMASIKELVRSVRAIRADMNVPNNRKTQITVVSEDADKRKTFTELKDTYQFFLNATRVDVSADKKDIADDAVSAVITGAAVYIPLADLVDIQQEIERLGKEQKRLGGEIKRASGMLNNQNFLSKAPEDKVNEEKAKLEKYKKMLSEVEARLAQLRK